MRAFIKKVDGVCLPSIVWDHSGRQGLRIALELWFLTFNGGNVWQHLVFAVLFVVAPFLANVFFTLRFLPACVIDVLLTVSVATIILVLAWLVRPPITSLNEFTRIVISIVLVFACDLKHVTPSGGALLVFDPLLLVAFACFSVQQ